MAKPFNKMKEELEAKGYTPFVCIVKWSPAEELTFFARFLQSFNTPEGTGVKGVHTWNLIGKNTMIVVGWMNSPVSLQKFCESVTYGTGITMEASPAIDHFGLEKALRGLKSTSPMLKELRSLLAKMPVPK